MIEPFSPLPDAEAAASDTAAPSAMQAAPLFGERAWLSLTAMRHSPAEILESRQLGEQFKVKPEIALRLLPTLRQRHVRERLRDDPALADWLLADPYRLAQVKEKLNSDPAGLYPLLDTMSAQASPKAVTALSATPGDALTGLNTGGVPNSQQAASPEMSFLEALETGLGNLDGSFEIFAHDLWAAIKRPDQTLIGFGKIIAGYGCQLMGIEGDSRAYSDKVTEYFKGRYGSWDTIKKTIAEDPVGLAADISTIFTLGGGAARGLAKASTVANKAAPAGRIAQGAEKAVGALHSAADVAGKISAITDPLNIAGKGLYSTMRPMLEDAAKISPQNVVHGLAKAGAALSRPKSIAGVAGTQQAIDRERQEQ